MARFQSLGKRGRWSSRKFWAAMFWQAVMTILVVMDRLDQSIFETLTFLILGGYFLSNVVEKGAASRDAEDSGKP